MCNILNRSTARPLFDAVKPIETFRITPGYPLEIIPYEYRTPKGWCIFAAFEKQIKRIHIRTGEAWAGCSISQQEIGGGDELSKVISGAPDVRRAEFVDPPLVS